MRILPTRLDVQSARLAKMAPFVFHHRIPPLNRLVTSGALWFTRAGKPGNSFSLFYELGNKRKGVESMNGLSLLLKLFLITEPKLELKSRANETRVMHLCIFPLAFFYFLGRCLSSMIGLVQTNEFKSFHIFHLKLVGN